MSVLINLEAIKKAQNRLQKAAQCIAKVEGSKSYAEFESAWSDLLLALNTVYAALEQGSKSTPQGRQWFGGKKRERRTDPLLQYLHQARNADEHGLAPISKLQGSRIAIGKPGEKVHIEHLSIDGKGDISFRTKAVDGKHPTVEITPPRAVLVAVKDDRFGTSFDPPPAHLGQTLTDNSPLAVAKLGFEHHERLVGEALSIAQKTS